MRSTPPSAPRAAPRRLHDTPLAPTAPRSAIVAVAPAASAPAGDAAAITAALPTHLTREQILDVLWTLPPQEMASVLSALSKGTEVVAPPSASSIPVSTAPPPPIEIREKLATIDLEDDDLETMAPVIITPAQFHAVPPPAPVVAAPVAMPLAAPVPTPVPTPVAMPLPMSVPMSAPVAPVAAVAAVAPEIARPAPRPSAPDPMDLLFDAMYELNFFETSVEGASYCLASLLRALPSRAGLVHLLDPDTREFVTVYGQGPSAERQVLQRITDDDWLVGAAVCKSGPLVMNYGGEVSGRPMDRHAFFGDVRSVVVAPVVSWRRCLAVIELIDPADGGVYDVRAENALAYVAERYAEFLAEHGVDVSNVVAPPSGLITV